MSDDLLKIVAQMQQEMKEMKEELAATKKELVETKEELVETKEEVAFHKKAVEWLGYKGTERWRLTEYLKDREKAQSSVFATVMMLRDEVFPLDQETDCE